MGVDSIFPFTVGSLNEIVCNRFVVRTCRLTEDGFSINSLNYLEWTAILKLSENVTLVAS